MCKACKMDPTEVQRFRTRQGAVDADDFEKEVNYNPKTKKSKRAKRYPGCPENNKGPHIYVWTTEQNNPSLFADHYGYEKFEKKICAGCGHVDKMRHTEAYNKQNEKVFAKRPRHRYSNIKWFRFEDHDEKFAQKRRRYLARHGLDDYAFSSRWGA